MMRTHDTIVIGAGQAGLAVSHHLTALDVDHIVLERGRLAERWRSERWDSLRLLTPNWMTRLPGLSETVEDADGFRTKDEFVALLEGYAGSFSAPVREGVEVVRVGRADGRFTVSTSSGYFSAARLVVATGHLGRPSIPPIAGELVSSIQQIHASRYRSPDAIQSGGVLVVGAGASGIQIAAELRNAGRDVVLSTGRHARAVRRYRGRDLWWWLERNGSLDQTVDEVADVEAARSAPGLGLTGAGGGADIDLGTLQRSGVVLAGRTVSAEGNIVGFGDNLAGDVAAANVRLWRLLDRFDALATQGGLDTSLGPALRPVPVAVLREATALDLGRGFGSVVWATGYRPNYEWLDLDVLDARGEIIQRRGVTPIEGLYVLGVRFQWTRGSHLIDRVGRDAEHVAHHIADLGRASAAA